MYSNRKLTALSSAILLATLSACGGGGGGGATPGNTPRQQLTPLPLFLQGIEAQCQFVEGGKSVSLVDYTGNLGNVTGLSCEGVTLTDLNEISLLTALQSLSLENAGLTSVAELLGNTSLTELDLSGNSPADLATISSLLNLTKLDLEDCGLDVISLLHELTALKELDLSGNGISDITDLGNLTGLTKLDLAGNQITDVTHLGSLTNLTELDLSGNNDLSCVDVNNLDNNLGGTTDIAVPGACTSALIMAAGSAAERTIDNSQQAEPFVRVTISDVNGLQAVVLFQAGDDLRIEANTSAGVKKLTFIQWFVDAPHQVTEFEVGDKGVFSYNELREEVGLGLALTEDKDTYLGTSNKDIVYGLGEADVIAGGYGADVIEGGKGDDKLSGYRLTIDGDTVTRFGSSDGTKDTFVYNSGDGNDTLFEYETNVQYRSLLKFGPDIASEDITLYRDGGNLILKLDDANSITIEGWYTNTIHRIGEIQFGSNTVLKADEWVSSKPLQSLSKTVEGTSADETLIGSELEDYIYGGGGVDIIEGGQGDDKLSGNRLTIDGDTVTRFGSSDGAKDTFVYNSGDGNDTLFEYETNVQYRSLLKFGPDIASEDIALYRDGNNLILKFDNANSITIDGWYAGSYYNYRIGEIQFGASEPLNANDWVNAQAIQLEESGILVGTSEPNILLGTTGNDVIYGYGNADIIEGGKGDDRLSGHLLTIDGDTVTRYGSSDGFKDTFIYNSDDGNDTLFEYETNVQYRSLLKFGPGITAEAITASQSGNDLILTISATESVTIDGWFTSTNHRLGQIQFDGDELPRDAETFVNTLLIP